MIFKRSVIILVFLVTGAELIAQLNPFFYNLNTTNGLSYIGVADMCVDKKGNLWIATGNGLNMFNGKTVDKYFATEYPQLQSSNILSVTCDKDNQIWVVTAGGHVTMLDEKRKMHKVTLRKDDKPVKTFNILQTPDGRLYLYANKGMYQYIGKDKTPMSDSLDNSQFNFLSLNGYEKYRSMGGNVSFAFDENYYLLVFKEGILKVNYKTNTVEGRLEIPHAHALSKWGKDELLYYDVDEWRLKIINIVTLKTSYPLQGLKDQFDRDITAAVVNEAKPINDHQYLLTTQNEGIYIR